MKNNPNSAAYLLVASSRLENHWSEKLVFSVILFTVVLSTLICAQQFHSVQTPTVSQSASVLGAGQLAAVPAIVQNPGKI